MKVIFKVYKRGTDTVVAEAEAEYNDSDPAKAIEQSIEQNRINILNALFEVVVQFETAESLKAWLTRLQAEKNTPQIVGTDGQPIQPNGAKIISLT